VDAGGGLGVAYRRGRGRTLAAAEHVAVVREVLHDFPGRLVFEPGRWLVAEAGVLLTRVLRVKPGPERAFLVVDAAMNDLPRPVLYGAWHRDRTVDNGPGPSVDFDGVGPGA